MASTAEIEYSELEAKLAAVGIDAYDVCVAAGINRSGRFERRALPALREALAGATVTVKTRGVCHCGDNAECDTHGNCYDCGGYNRAQDVMA